MKSVLLRTLPAILAVALIGGCGGDSAKLGGTAATGAPVVGGDVTVTCAIGPSSTATTGADGTWEIGAHPKVYPCIAKVTGGSLPAGTTLYGYATSESNVNVTPLTTLIGAYATYAADGGPLTKELLDAATTKVVGLLTDAGFTNIPEDLLTSSFSAVHGDHYDDLIEALLLSFTQQGTTLTQVLGEITSGGAPTSAAFIPPHGAFDSIPDPLSSSYPSYGVEAYAGYPLKTIGDDITLQPNTPRNLREVSIVLKSYACSVSGIYTDSCVTTNGATFTHPVTVTIYNDANEVIATKTQTFTMPYRPSSDAGCTGDQAGWWKDASGTCYAGITFKVTFDMASLNVTLPETLHYAFSFNTSNGGPDPIHGDPADGPYPYDSLNFAVIYPGVAPIVGTRNLGDLSTLLWNGVSDADDGSLLVQFLVSPPQNL